MTVTPSPQSVVVPEMPLPCPFCGCKVAEAGFWFAKTDTPPMAYVFCLECSDTEATDGPKRETLEEAIAAWNRRAAPAPSSLAGGEVTNDDAPTYMRLAQALSRHPEVMVVERSDPTLELTPDSLEHLLDDVFPLAALSPEAPAREGVAKAIYLKLIDTLKPFAEVAEKLKHCHVVEICEPTPDNPSRNIIPIPREWFERAADDLEVIAIQLHSDGVLSEGQTAKLTGLDRAEVRKQADALTPRHEAPASPSERELDLLDAVMRAGGIVKTAAALPDKAAHLSLLTDALNRADAILTEGLNSAPISHEAPAEGAGEVVKACADFQEAIDYFEADVADALAEDSERADLWDREVTVNIDALKTVMSAALRARSSAPEAREEALGNLLAVIHGDGGHRALEVGTKQAALEAEKIVAGLFAAPSADKLRTAVEALEPFANLGVSSGPDDEPCHYAYRITRGAIRNARQALATLKAEG